MNTKEKTYTAIEHIANVKSIITALVAAKQDYAAFILIAIGIEFLGAFFDEHPFDNRKKKMDATDEENKRNKKPRGELYRKTRFNLALKKLFRTWYSNNQDFLFREFRNPMVHQFRIGEKIRLTTKHGDEADLNSHTKVIDGKTILVLEVLVDDFIKACNSLVTLSKKNNSAINKKKLNEEYIDIILSKTQEGKSFSSTGVTNTKIEQKLEVPPKLKYKKNENA